MSVEVLSITFQDLDLGCTKLSYYIMKYFNVHSGRFFDMNLLIFNAYFIVMVKHHEKVFYVTFGYKIQFY